FVRRLRIGILDLVSKTRTRALWARVMHANLASIMPQALAVWCEEAGHDVSLVCFTGFEDLPEELPSDIDLLFIGAFTQAAQLAYSVSNLFRQRGVITVLGGPHARCYPDDASKYFDYVVGFTDKAVIQEVLEDCSPHRPIGACLSAKQQPAHLPGVRERWKFIEPTLAKAPTRIKIVPMIASLGCPYTCSFCIDSVVDYRPLDCDQIREDLRFLVKRMPKAMVGWHDPNFGVRFNDCMGAIEDGIGESGTTFAAESTLSLLSEPNLRRLRDAGFKALLPGIESWYTLGNKSKTGAVVGIEKVNKISEHVNLMLHYVPYVQANFVLGLDVDEGDEPFELTKRFLDKTPGAFPGYSLLTAFGEAAPLNLELQRANRVLPFPFHFLNNNHAMNVRPKNYGWAEFYDRVIDLSRYSFSWKAIARRARATQPGFASWLNIVRAVSSEGFGRIKYYQTIRRLLDTDRSVRRFFDGETSEVPSFFVERVKRDLGPLWEYLPAGALNHDPNAYLKKTTTQVAALVTE
ncbi:MAG: radical SAM protein, partial [Gemmatimonadota bacterium]